MNPTQSTSLTTNPPTPTPSPTPPHLLRPVTTGPVAAWVRFWFAPVNPVGLHVVRLLSGLLFLGWLLPYAGHLNSLFGLEGWFDRQAYAEAMRLEGGPPFPLGWSILYACGSSSWLLATVYWVSLAILTLFTLGFWTRLTAVLSWVIVVSFTANPVLGFDGEALLLVLSFYLMLGYLLQGKPAGKASLLSRLLGPTWTPFFSRTPGEPGASATGGEGKGSVAANLALRLLQVHLAIVLVSSGLHKLQFGDWWAGTALWFPLHPAFQTTLTSARANQSWGTTYLFFLSLFAYITLVWEIAFPLFAWRRRWRPILLAGGLIGCLGTAFLYRIPVFGPALFVACLSFVSPAGWYRLRAILARRPRSGQTAAGEVEKDKKGSLVPVEQH